MTAIALNQKTADGLCLKKTSTDKPVADSNLALGPGGSGNDPGAGGFSIKKVLVLLIASLIIGAGCCLAYKALDHVNTFQDTDNAYVTGHLHHISSRVSGTVEHVLVEDNQHVKKGQLLVILDKRDFQVKVDRALTALKRAERQAHVAMKSVEMASVTASGQDTQAQSSISDSEAAIARAEAGVLRSTAQLGEARADVAAKEAERARAQSDFQRFDSLALQGAVSRQQADLAKRDFVVAEQAKESSLQKVSAAEASYQQSVATVTSAKAALLDARGKLQLAKASKVQTHVSENQYEVANAAIEEAEVELKEARLNLSYAMITAATSGRIGKKSVEVGQRVEPGQPLLTIVSDDTWVLANFKETQLAKMRPGQIVDLKIDSFPEHKFRGIVESVAPGAGSSFSVLPSDNATGNFTKIVQRVPVKILFDKSSLGSFVRRVVPGMSVEVGVNVNK